MSHTKKPLSNKSKNRKSLFSAFTLVELIVVIVILALLATIAFLSFNSYSSSSRDSVRLADVANLNKGVELYNVKSGYYPLPNGVISSGTVNGVSVVYKGIVGDNISELANINKTPVDPLSSSNYVYGISYDKKYFQIGLVLENYNTTGYNSNSNLLSFGVPVESTLAGSGAGTYYSRIKGNYAGMIKFSSGTTNKSYYIANIPSLIYNNNGTVDLLYTGTYFVVNNNTNLPYSISPSVTTNNKTADTIIKEVTNKTTATLTGVDITSIVNTADSTTRNNLINSTFSGVTLDSFGGNVGVLTAVISGGNTSGGENTVTKVWSGSGTTGIPYVYSENGTPIYPKSCNDILISTGTSFNTANTNGTITYNGANATKFKDGTYTINPSGINGSQFDVYCDMTSDGGGWTLIVGIDGANQNHNTLNSVTPSNISSVSGKGKFSDVDINILRVAPRSEGIVRLNCGNVDYFDYRTTTWHATYSTYPNGTGWDVYTQPWGVAPYSGAGLSWGYQPGPWSHNSWGQVIIYGYSGWLGCYNGSATGQNGTVWVR